MKNGPILSALTVSVWDLDLQLLWHSSVLSVSFWYGTIFSIQIMPASYQPISIFILAPLHSSYWLA